MKRSNCPQCGAPAGSGFFCDDCGGPLFGDENLSRAEEPRFAPPEPAPSQAPPGPSVPYAFPGDARAAMQAYPPGPGQTPPPGYASPPGTPGYRPRPRKAPRGLVLSRKEVIIGGVLFALLAITVAVILLFIKPSTPPRINVPAPPGMAEMTGIFRDMEEESIKAGLNEGKLDAYCMNMDTGDTLIAISYSSRGYGSVPPEDAGLEEMEEWIGENRASIEQGFLDDFAGLLEIDESRVELEELGAVQLASGDIAIHNVMYTYDQKTRTPTGMNVLVFSKKGTIYMVMLLVSSGGTGQNTMNYLMNNISFE